MVFGIQKAKNVLFQKFKIRLTFSEDFFAQTLNLPTFSLLLFLSVLTGHFISFNIQRSLIFASWWFEASII